MPRHTPATDGTMCFAFVPVHARACHDPRLPDTCPFVAVICPSCCNISVPCWYSPNGCTCSAIWKHTMWCNRACICTWKPPDHIPDANEPVILSLCSAKNSIICYRVVCGYYIYIYIQKNCSLLKQTLITILKINNGSTCWGCVRCQCMLVDSLCWLVSLQEKSPVIAVVTGSAALQRKRQRQSGAPAIRGPTRCGWMKSECVPCFVVAMGVSTSELTNVRCADWTSMNVSWIDWSVGVIVLLL